MRTTWNVTKLADAPIEIVDGDRGKNYPQHTDFMDNGFCLFLNAGNVTNSGFSFNNLQFITAEKDEILRKGKLHRNDVVLTTRGTIGNAAYYDEKVPFEHMRINSGMVILRCDQNHILPSFVYHYLRSPSFHAQVNAFRSGVAQPQLPIRDMRQIEVPVPTLIEQQHIANLLSAYDDLIENNRRRIQLLEKSARLLYKEWFVYLRFPGHEHVKVVDGVPAGWEKKPIAELCERIDYGYTASAAHEEVGPKFLRITDIVPASIDWASVPYCKIADDKLVKFRLCEGDIIIARTGATVGYAKRIHKLNHNAVFASYLVRLRLKPTIDNLLVGLYVESQDFKNYVHSRIGGAAQPNANAKVLAGAEILVPTPALQRNFRDAVEPLIDQREILQRQNQKLIQARDLLLPRLMNGEIEV